LSNVITVTKIDQNSLWRLPYNCAMCGQLIDWVPYVRKELGGTRRHSKYYHEACYPRDSRPR
jgi:hypothetical protein